MATLNRRTLLRGLGTAIALPLLDSMAPVFSRGAASKSPCRMAFVYVPNGIIMDAWTPVTEGQIAPLPAELPRVSAPLAAWRDDMIMLGGLTCNGGRALGDGAGDHGRAGAAYLTATHPKKTAGKDIHTGISVDQIAAQHIGSQTRFASLELGCEDGVQGGNCDNGYSCAYSNSISWRSPSNPMPPEVRPRAVFERLFGSDDFGQDPVKRARQMKYQASILDAALSDAQRLKSALGASDRAKLDEYLFAVRDIESRIQKTEKLNAQNPAPAMAEPSSSVPDDMTEHSKLMFDLMTIAFQTNMTRVITMAMATEQSTRPYREIGVAEGHHGLTHHQGDKEKIEKVTQINRFHVEQFTYFLTKLKATRDGDGSLLDHSMIVYGSGLSDGNRHLHENLPTVLAGRGCGTLKPGRHIKYEAETPMANFFVAMLDRMGVPVDQMGDSTGEIGYLSDL
ncbi:MAG: DUF1552 domain-containing protein [Bryobacteraceae bacterium]